MNIDKVKQANEIVKEWVKKHYESSHYAYIDFAEEDRFVSEIETDEDINISENTAAELAEYAIEKISHGSRLALLFGY